MQKSIFLTFLLAPVVVAAQDGDAFRSYRFQDFSERYEATLEILDTDDVFRPGVIRVFDRDDPQSPVIEVESDELVLHLDGDEVRANVQEVPYGEQSLILSGDFNFDGAQDLAVMDGQFSCYHGPSYQVYLGTDEGLRHNEAFTRLAQEYCGFFQVDSENQQIHTMTKSGCCWHEYSTFEVRDGVPVVERVVELDHGGARLGMPWETVYRNEGGELTEVSHSLMWDSSYVRELLSFRMQSSGKRAVFFSPDAEDDRRLYYAFMDAENRIELLYPDGDGEFWLERDTGVLGFDNEDARYRVAPSGVDGEWHMIVEYDGREHRLAIDPESVVGSTLTLDTESLVNVEVGED